MESTPSRSSSLLSGERPRRSALPVAEVANQQRSSLFLCNKHLTDLTDLNKHCQKCNAPWTGFGQTCSSCRKVGKVGSTVQCEGCRGWYVGYTAMCDECVLKTQEAEEDPELAVKLLQRSQGKAPAAQILARLAEQDTDQRKSIVDAGGVAPLVRLLVGEDSDPEAKGNAAKALKKIAATSKENRKFIGDAASVEEFLALLQDGEEDTEIQLIAAQGLKVAAVLPLNKQLIVDLGGHHLLVELLRRWTGEGQAVAAWTLNNIIIGSAARKVAVFKAGAVPHLIRIMRHGSEEGKLGAAATVQNLAVVATLRDFIIEVGAVPPLVELLREGPVAGQVKAADALRNLCLGSDARAATIAKQEEVISLLVKMWETGSKEAKKSASDALRELANNSPLRLQAIAVAGGAGAL